MIRSIRLALPAVLALCALLIAMIAVAAPAVAQDYSHLTRVWQNEWTRTDFNKFSVDLTEIVSGGPPRDGIPPIDTPRFESAAQAETWLAPQEPVLVVEHASEARAYPLQILIWHEIVNDTLAELPVVITFCPLCNSALVFDRRVQGRVLDFGTTGKLRMSDLVMWDRQTESWWQQLTGEAIVGTLTGSRLTYLPAPLVSFESFRAAHPQGRVLSRKTGFQRSYGSNPYVGYDAASNTRPFLFNGTVDDRLLAVERVVALERDGAAKAYPYSELARAGAVNDRVGGLDVVVFHRAGTRSALDGAIIARSRDVGTGAVFECTVQGRTLTFRRDGDRLVDEETRSQWDVLGRAVQGPLRGQRLRPVVHGNHFAFAWLAFRPHSQIYRAP